MANNFLHQEIHLQLSKMKALAFNDEGFQRMKPKFKHFLGSAVDKLI